jgi:hypothetical protein
LLLRLRYLAAAPCRFRDNFLHRTSSLPSIDSVIGFILYVTPTSSTVSLSPLQVLKGGIASDPSSLVSTVRRHPRFIESKVHQVTLESSIVKSSLSPSLPCLQVLKGGIISDSPIHAFILDPSSPKHFVRFIFVCQPPTLIDAKIFVLGIQLPYSSSFFSSLVLDLSLNSRYIKISIQDSR